MIQFFSLLVPVVKLSQRPCDCHYTRVRPVPFSCSGSRCEGDSQFVNPRPLSLGISVCWRRSAMTNDGVVNTFVLASSVAVRVLPKADSKEWDYPVVVLVIRCCSNAV